MAPTTTLTTMAPSVTPDYRTDGKLKGCGNWQDKVTGEMFRGITDYAGCADRCDNYRGAFSCRGFFLGVNGHTGCAITDGSCTFKDGRNFNYYEKTGTSAPVAATTPEPTPAPVSTLYSLDQRRVGCAPFSFANGEYDNSKAYTPHECYLKCKNSAKACVEFFVGVNGQDGCATSDGYCAGKIVQGRNFNYYKVNALATTMAPQTMEPTTTVAPSNDDWNLLAADTGCQGWPGLAWKAWKGVTNDRVLAGSFAKNTLQDCTDMCDEEAQCTVFYYSESSGKCALTNGQCTDQDSGEYHKYEVAV